MRELVQVLHGYLIRGEMFELLKHAMVDTDWEAGRQGTGYAKLDIKSIDRFKPIIERAVRDLGVAGARWDAWLVRYPDGTGVHAHTDPATFGMRHRRVNVLLHAALDGGKFIANGIDQQLEVGDAVFFYPDEVEHSVTPCVGERIILSVGALL